MSVEDGTGRSTVASILLLANTVAVGVLTGAKNRKDGMSVLPVNTDPVRAAKMFMSWWKTGRQTKVVYSLRVEPLANALAEKLGIDWDGSRFFVVSRSRQGDSASDGVCSVFVTPQVDRNGELYAVVPDTKPIRLSGAALAAKLEELAL